MAFFNTTRRQAGTLYDLIAQGEIEGVVGGYAGVYFNGTSLVDEDTAGSIAPKYGSGTIANSGPGGVAQITSYGKLFDGVDVVNGDRYVLVRQAGDSTTLSSAAVKGSDEISVTDGAFFPEEILK